MTTAFPEWFSPGPAGGWTADMLDHLPPDAPRHVELIDGALVMMSPQTAFHMFILRRFEQDLVNAIAPAATPSRSTARR